LTLLRALRKFTSNLKQFGNDCPTSQLEEKFSSEPISSGTLSSQAYIKALLSLPHHILVFYVHSYCSLVWNKIAEKRLRQFGTTVLEGDMVMKESTDKVCSLEWEST